MPKKVSPTNPTSLHPMNNRIMVVLDQQKEEILGGIIIPERAKQVPSEGVVIELGSQNIDISSGKHIPWSVEVGQRLLIQKFAGYTQKVDGQEYQFILEGDVIAVIK